MNIQKILGIELPIIQGGMANVSKSQLAAAVSEAGGLGLVATGGFSPEEIREEIRNVRKLTDKPFGVSIVLIHPQVEEVIDVVIEEGVDIITCGAGNPAPYFDKWKAAGIRVIPVIANIKMAKKVEELGAVACVFEGNEAGGHIGSLNTMPELPAIADAVSIPVVSAGGIYNGRQVLAAEVLGAQGVQVGSRLLVAEECPIHENYKQYLIDAKDSDTIVTGYATGHPVRTVKNPLSLKLQELDQACASPEEFEKLGVGAGRRAAENGDMETGSIMAGQGLAYLTKVEPVKVILQRMMEEYEEAKAGLCK